VIPIFCRANVSPIVEMTPTHFLLSAAFGVAGRVAAAAFGLAAG
jgi:hypothetical protein